VVADASTLYISNDFDAGQVRALDASSWGVGWAPLAPM
jgi:hypothetical protein